MTVRRLSSDRACSTAFTQEVYPSSYLPGTVHTVAPARTGMLSSSGPPSAAALPSDAPPGRMVSVSGEKPRVGRAVRFIASGGWATEDEDVLIELLDRAERLATAVVADQGASPSVRSLGTEFLEHMTSDRSG
jgi:hypothetical protein